MFMAFWKVLVSMESASLLLTVNRYMSMSQLSGESQLSVKAWWLLSIQAFFLMGPKSKLSIASCNALKFPVPVPLSAVNDDKDEGIVNQTLVEFYRG